MSLISKTASIVSLSFSGITPLPQLPITGLITRGNPTFSKFSAALSLENEKYVFRCWYVIFFQK